MEDDKKLAVASFIRHYGLIALFGFLGVSFLVIGLFSGEGEPEREIIFEENDKEEIYVDVSGAVINPGVYKLDSNSRIQDAVIAAGGISVDADREYIEKNVNMARIVEDGEKIYFYFDGELDEKETGEVDGTADVGEEAGGLVNLNTASEAEMDGLPGVGPVTVGKIVAGRPYSSLEELLEEGVLGEAQFEKIKDLASVR